MSKTRLGFLVKVSDRMKKNTVNDEPNATSDSLIIDRFQALAGSESPDLSKKNIERTPKTVGAVDTQCVRGAVVHEPSVAASGNAAYETSEPTAEEAIPLKPYPDSPLMEELPFSDNPAVAKTSRRMATILVVDDEIVTQRLMRTILEERGYEVVVAEDGVDALMALGKNRFDLILCDINMPNIDGFTLVEFLNKKNILIPVIFITVREEVEDEIRGLALGARDYIHKPINRDLLLLRISKALDK